MSNYRTHAFREFKAAGWLTEDGKFKDDFKKQLFDDANSLRPYLI